MTDTIPLPTTPEGAEPRAVTLLTAEQVREFLGLKSVRSVYKLSRRHGWRFQRTIGHRTVRYERRGLLEWIRGRTRRPQAKP
jgi:hypothetical protein